MTDPYSVLGLSLIHISFSLLAAELYDWKIRCGSAEPFYALGISGAYAASAFIRAENPAVFLLLSSGTDSPDSVLFPDVFQKCGKEKPGEYEISGAEGQTDRQGRPDAPGVPLPQLRTEGEGSQLSLIHI